MRINNRTILKCTLEAQTAIAVGGLGSGVDSDLELAVDGQGKYYIPGTSLAGPLRGDESLWGFQKNDKGHASRVVVRDAEIETPNREVREHVVIGSQLGTAENGKKYNRAVLAKGTKINVEIQLDTLAEPKDEVDRLVGLLTSGALRLGAAKTRGLGRVKSECVKVKSCALGTKEGLFAFLNKTLPYETRTSGAQGVGPRTWDPHWEPNGPLMVKAARDGFAVDALPQFSKIGEQYRLVVPGSSWKGALRATAELIVNTVREWDPWEDSLDRNKPSEAARCPLVVALFGAIGHSTHRTNTGRIGALRVDDVYSQDSFNKDELGLLTGARNVETELKTAILARQNIWAYAPHVAIDRWTSGPSEGALFSVLEPHNVVWDRLHVELDMEALRRCLPDEADFSAAIGLLLVVWREVRQERVPIGAHVNRGMGQIKNVEELTMEQETRDRAARAWREWCNRT